MLQETKLGTEQQVESLAYFMRRYFECFSSKANAHSGGSSVLIRKGRGIEICPERETDHNGRISAVEVLYRGELHKLVSVYAPNDIAERKNFFIALREYVDTPCKTVLAGDFNCVLHAADCSRGLRSDVSRGELRKLLRDFDLQDVQECAPGPCLEYTHWQGSSHARLDRVYVSSELAAGSSAYDVQPLAFSDHALVTVAVGMAARPKNPSSWWSGWKLNESLLEDEVLRAELEEIIRKKSDGKVVDAVMWEELKQDVKLAAYRFSQKRAACKKAKKRSLAQTLRALIVEENKTPGVFTDDIRECKGRILELLEQEYKGAMIRSRTLTLERDEEPRKIFKTRERQHAGRNRIVKLHVGRDVVTRQEDIEAAFVKAYTTLLTAAENESLSGEYGGPMPRVSEELREQINRKIDVDEVKRAIKELAPRKSPGVDGLGSLFYKTFAEQLAPILRDVFADILRRGLLPPSMRQAVTVLIPKKHVVGPRGLKGRRCLVIDPSNAEIRLKIHWIPSHVSNDAVRKAMEPYGKVTEVKRETWKAEGFEGIESATRLVRINLKEETTIDGIPHQLRLFGANSLIVIPGRAPLCLRCKHTGHIRRDCRVPLCSECQRFGHESDDCMKTYATAVGRQEIDPVHAGTVNGC
ncbi:hypothetical protein ISCGN_003567 [Ixodes scapularis]